MRGVQLRRKSRKRVGQLAVVGNETGRLASPGQVTGNPPRPEGLAGWSPVGRSRGLPLGQLHEGGLHVHRLGLEHADSGPQLHQVTMQVLDGQLILVQADREAINLGLDRGDSGDGLQLLGERGQSIDDLDVHNPEHAQLPIDFVHRPLGDHLPRLDDADARAELGKFLEDMAGNEDGFAHVFQGL